jgi:methionyl-tRNA formyltransferase
MLPGQVKKGTVATVSDPSWADVSFDPAISIMETIEQAGIPYKVATSSDINSIQVINEIRERHEPVFIYSGYGGVLLKKELLQTEKKFLHVHGGYLPDFKGSTTNYFSLLNEESIGASAIFLNEEIDSGPVLLRRKFQPPANRQEIDHLYDGMARSRVLIETLKAYNNTNEWRFELEDNRGGETYFIIHPVLKHIAILAK